MASLLKGHSLKQVKFSPFVEGFYKKNPLVLPESSLIQEEPKEMEKLGVSKLEENKDISAAPRKIGSQIGQSTRGIGKKLSGFFTPRSRL